MYLADWWSGIWFWISHRLFHSLHLVCTCHGQYSGRFSESGSFVKVKRSGGLRAQECAEFESRQGRKKFSSWSTEHPWPPLHLMTCDSNTSFTKNRLIFLPPIFHLPIFRISHWPKNWKLRKIPPFYLTRAMRCSWLITYKAGSRFKYLLLTSRPVLNYLKLIMY